VYATLVFVIRKKDKCCGGVTTRGLRTDATLNIVFEERTCRTPGI
jgi:hypothetical protein